MEETDPKKKFEIVRFVVLSGWIVTIVVCAAILIASTYISFTELVDPPEFLKSQSNTALGFLIGSFVALVKDFIGSRTVN